MLFKPALLRQSIAIRVMAVLVLLCFIWSLHLVNFTYNPFAKPSKVPSEAQSSNVPTVMQPLERFNLSAAAAKMLNNPDQFQGFEWADWVDTVEMERLKEVAKGPQDKWPKEWKGNPYNETMFPPMSGPSEEELAINGRIFLVERMPKPRKVIFLGENHRIVNIKSDNNETDTKVDSSEDDILIAAMADKDLAKRVEIDIPWELFLFNVTEEAAKEIDPSWDLERQEHYKMIKFANENFNESERYFYEVPLGRLGVYYDWRFFSKLKQDPDLEAYRHHLIRTWSELTNQFGILSWIAFGSLLGWAQNGLTLPWNNYHDVQMPIRELDRFVRKFNQTLIVQDPKEGNGRYFIDVGPWYVERQRGNGANLVDGRFIDTRSGIYMDLTGLASSTPEIQEKKIVNNKNKNVYPFGSLSPARRTLYEGTPIYVPNQHRAILSKTYGSSTPQNKEWHFDQDLRLFVKNEDCFEFRNQSKKFDSEHELTMYGACNREEYMNEYIRTKNLTKEHADEMSLYDDYFRALSMNASEGNEVLAGIKVEFARMLSEYHAPLRYDPL